MRIPERRPTFLTIAWEQTHREQGRVVVVEATLCLEHRREIASRYPSARGCRRLGDSCDLCEGRKPRKA